MHLLAHKSSLRIPLTNEPYTNEALEFFRSTSRFNGRQHIAESTKLRTNHGLKRKHTDKIDLANEQRWLEKREKERKEQEDTRVVKGTTHGHEP